MIYAIISLVMGLTVTYISYKKIRKEEWGNLYDKTGIYSGMAIGLLLAIAGIFTLLHEILN
jgi:hypothetical protein